VRAFLPQRYLASPVEARVRKQLHPRRDTVRFRCNRFLRGWATKSSGLPLATLWAHHCEMGTKSRKTIYGSSVRAAAGQARAARKEADRLACQAWNKRMLGLQGPAHAPSPIPMLLRAS
jgi:hypothetical protein